MARLRGCFRSGLIGVLALVGMPPALAQEEAGLYDRPVLVLDPGMHTAPIRSADVDAEKRYAVTGSDDKTVRLWSVDDAEMLRTIRLPAGRGHVGKVYAVAISPDGHLIAAGGLMTEAIGQEPIYLFERVTGNLTGRIDGLPNIITHLTFSPDGRHLAATLGGANGLRVYDRYDGWAEFARDTNYSDASYWAAFSENGRLATTSDDGKLRLYDRSLKLVAMEDTAGGREPFGVAFGPDGSKLAVGYVDTTNVDIVDGRTLAPLSSPDTSGISNGNLLAVAWSVDGTTFFAGGRYNRGDGISPVVAWADAGSGALRELSAGTDSIMSLVPFADGVLVAAQDPYVARLDADGGEVWVQGPPQADFRYQERTLAVAADGQTVDFNYRSRQARARFSLNTLSLKQMPPKDTSLAPPKHNGLLILNWEDTFYPTLEGEPLRLQPSEVSRSLAIHPNSDRFVLGTEWYLRAFDAKGEQLWRTAVPGATWAVNISGDGRLVVAAYADGTIRWHRMVDGRELLAFFPLADRKNWVAWTPDGFYAATPGAHGVLRWHINHGWDAPGEGIPVSDIAELRRPEVLPLVLQEMDIVEALGLAELNEARLATQRRLDSSVPQGAQLHVLTIGVGEYNEEKAKHLRLKFADDDAWDVASALLNTQGSLYAKVNPQVLQDADATRAGISQALAALKEGMSTEAGDVAVIHFSGHGALVDGSLYLLPHEVDARNPYGIEGSAIPIGWFKAKLQQLAERGRVLVLLDACRSGAATADGTNVTPNAGLLRAQLAAANITVLTSSSGEENSIEHEKWRNGAFTEVFLEALGREADSDKNGVISMTELTRYVTTGVPRLVRQVRPGWQQTPDITVRFEHTIFAAGL